MIRYSTAPMVDQLDTDPLLAWRQQMLTFLLRFFVFITIPFVVFDVINQIQVGYWPIFLFNCIITTLGIGCLLRRQTNAWICASIIEALLLVMGIVGLHTFGIFGINPALMIIAVVIARLFFSLRATIVVVLFNVMSVLMIVGGINLGLFSSRYAEFQHIPETIFLVVNAVSILGVTALLARIIGSLVTTLQKSSATTQATLADLTHINTTLDTTIEQRGAEVRRTVALLEATQRVAQVGGCAYDPVQGTLLATEGFYRIHEVPEGTSIDVVVLKQLYPGTAWDSLEESFDRLKTSHTLEELEVAGLTFTGKPIWLRIGMSVEHDESGVRYLAAVKDITDLKATEHHLAQQLRYAESLARCARLLLAHREVGAPAWTSVTEALEHLRVALKTSRLFVYQYQGDPAEPEIRQVADATESGIPTLVSLPLTWDDEPRTMLETLRQRRIAGHVMGKRSPAYPHFQTLFDHNGLQSWLIVPIFVGEDLWGHIGVSDHGTPRIWDVAETQLLDTAAEMMGAFIQRQEIVSTLYDHETLLHSVNDALPNGYLYQMFQHRDGRFIGHTYVSRGVENLFGITPDQIYNNAELLQTMMHPDDRLRVNRVNQDAAQSLTTSDVEVRLRKTDGTFGWFQLRAIPQLRPDGLILWNGVCLEITVRKAVELALATSEAKYRTLFTLLPTGVLLTDHEQRIIEMNPAAEKLLGLQIDPKLPIYTSSAMQNLIQPNGDQFPNEAFPCVRALQEGRVIADVEMGILHVNAKTTWMSVSAAPLDLAPYGVVVTYADITARKEAEYELELARDVAESATRAKSAFLASMSHEIRTPLHAVIGMTDLLQETTLTDDQQMLVNTIHTGGEALLAVINDILDFSRIESGRVDLDLAPFDLPACLTSTTNLMMQGAHQKGVKIWCRVDESVPHAVIGDEARIRQILLNLLGNAVKFTRQGEIVLHAAADFEGTASAVITIEVSDTGIGIIPNHLEHIFKPFVQADINTARRYGGTGLGLAITWQLVNLMGGTITVASRLGQGSTFTVCIPMQVTSMQAFASTDDPMAQQQQPLLVLVAEDNPVNQDVISRMLNHLGHTVTVVADGQAAVEEVDQHPYDVVLMDVQMPVMDGEVATQQIRASSSQTHQPYIIALTANALAGDRERFLALGMNDYLSKPVHPIDLRRALAHVLVGQPNDQYPNSSEIQIVEGKPLIHWSTLNNLIESLGSDGPETAMTMVRLFEEVIPPQMNSLGEALVSYDIHQLQREAHRLRGGCLQVGARAMADLCQQIEYTSDTEDLTTLMARLRTCYAQTLTLLHDHYRM